MNNYFSPAQEARLTQLEQQQKFGSQYQSPFNQYQIPQQKNLNVQYDLISGIEEVKRYPIAPGKVGLLFDNQQNEFYMKTVDSIGMQSIKKFSYIEVELPATNSPSISPDSTLNKRIENIENALNQLLATTNKQDPKAEKKTEKTLFDGVKTK